MKPCAICMTENAVDAVTCVACGEGSFAAEAPAQVPSAPSLPSTDDASTVATGEPESAVEPDMQRVPRRRR